VGLEEGRKMIEDANASSLNESEEKYLKNKEAQISMRRNETPQWVII
jgi:hypothetical protein